MNGKNRVATVLKYYSIINFLVCIVLSIYLNSEYHFSAFITIIFVATSIVVNFAIYAFGEIIQLLHDIKQNTAPAQEKEKAVENELPTI